MSSILSFKDSSNTLYSTELDTISYDTYNSDSLYSGGSQTGKKTLKDIIEEIKEIESDQKKKKEDKIKKLRSETLIEKTESEVKQFEDYIKQSKENFETENFLDLDSVCIYVKEIIMKEMWTSWKESFEENWTTKINTEEVESPYGGYYVQEHYTYINKLTNRIQKTYPKPDEAVYLEKYEKFKIRFEKKDNEDREWFINKIDENEKLEKCKDNLDTLIKTTFNQKVEAIKKEFDSKLMEIKNSLDKISVEIESDDFEHIYKNFKKKSTYTFFKGYTYYKGEMVFSYKPIKVFLYVFKEIEVEKEKINKIQEYIQEERERLTTELDLMLEPYSKNDRNSGYWGVVDKWDNEKLMKSFNEACSGYQIEISEHIDEVTTSDKYRGEAYTLKSTINEKCNEASRLINNFLYEIDEPNQEGDLEQYPMDNIGFSDFDRQSLDLLNPLFNNFMSSSDNIDEIPISNSLPDYTISVDFERQNNMMIHDQGGSLSDKPGLIPRMSIKDLTPNGSQVVDLGELSLLDRYKVILEILFIKFLRNGYDFSKQSATNNNRIDIKYTYDHTNPGYYYGVVAAPMEVLGTAYSTRAREGKLINKLFTPIQFYNFMRTIVIFLLRQIDHVNPTDTHKYPNNIITKYFENLYYKMQDAQDTDASDEEANKKLINYIESLRNQWKPSF